MKTLSRGQRNHNWLNIRKSGNRWAGMAKKQLDPSFVQFTSDKMGFRAAFIILKRYYNVYHLLTIEQIITRWAPPQENVTRNYVRFVKTMCLLNDNQVLPLFEMNPKKWTQIVYYMATYECGAKPQMKDIEEAFGLVFKPRRQGVQGVQGVTRR